MSRISINYIISNLKVHEYKLKKRAFTVGFFFIKKPERTVIFVIFPKKFICMYFDVNAAQFFNQIRYIPN